MGVMAWLFGGAIHNLGTEEQTRMWFQPLKVSLTKGQGLSCLCVQRVIWTPRTLFFDSLDTQKFMSGFADDDFS